MSDARHDRIRGELGRESVNAIVLTEPNDVFYATGYECVMDKWNLQERIAATIVPTDSAKPVILCLPEANVAVLAVMASQGKPDRAQELRRFDLLTFCEMARATDPHAGPSHIGSAAVKIFQDRVRGDCQPEMVASIAEALQAHGLTDGLIAFDDLRVGYTLARRGVIRADAVVDGLDAMVRARVIKTHEELEIFRRIGPLADETIQFAASQLEPGVAWNEIQYRVADFMVRHGLTPFDEGAMLFGGVFEGEFIPELFRTRHGGPLENGQIVILETLGRAENYWIDINRTATIGKPRAEYQRLHDHIRDAYEKVIAHMRPGVSTGELPRIAFDHIKAKGVSAPEKLLIVAHAIGIMPLETPLPFPAHGLRGARGFTLEKDMVLSVDCLYFGSEFGPCHMENVFIVEHDRAVSTYRTPHELLGPR
jgi:Xaa-Pro aminopeptidase